MTRAGAGRGWLAAPVFAGLAGLAAPAAADSQDLVERARFEVKPAGRAFTELSVDNPLGDVRVEGYNGSTIQIETRKHGPSEEAVDRLRISLVPNADGTVRITSTADRSREDRPLARGAVRIDMIILAPHDVRVDATVSSGTLEVLKMDRGGELDSASGKIMVNNVQGDLSTHSVSGQTSLTQVFGSIDAQTISSNLDLDSITGERLIASANDGRITGRRVRSRHVELTTVNGTILFEGEIALRGRMIVASMKGDVDVRLRRNGAVVLRARGAKINLGTTTGRDLPDGTVEAKLGQAAAGAQPALIELRSRYANVHFAIIE